MTDLSAMVRELKDAVVWQETPQPLSDEQYESLVIHGIQYTYVSTGRANLYLSSDVIYEHGVAKWFAKDLLIDECMIANLTARIEFFRKVQTAHNNMVSYSTDAISIAHADKPFQHINSTIKELERERRILQYKVIRYLFL